MRNNAKRRTFLLLIITLIAGCANMFSLSGNKKYSPDDIASYELPDNWTPREPTRESDYALHEYRRSQRWWFKAGDPLEVHAWVVITSPRADSAAFERGVEDAMKRVRTSTEFPSFGSFKDGDRETWVYEGNYQINTLHKPEQVLFVKSVDRARKVAFVARVYKRKIDHEALQKITRTFFTSFTFGARREAFFAEVADWPTVRAERVRSERAYIDSMLLSQGLPAARLDETVARDGWIYTLRETSFSIGRLLGSKRMQTPGYGARVELAWLRYTGSEWKSWRPSSAAFPKRGQPYQASEYAMTRWGDEMQPPLDRSLAWFFHVKDCRLTGSSWEDARTVAPCVLDDWFDYARGVEKAFTAGELFVE